MITSKVFPVSISNSQLFWLVKNPSPNSRILLHPHNVHKYFGKNENIFNILLATFTNLKLLCLVNCIKYPPSTSFAEITMLGILTFKDCFFFLLNH